MHSVTQSMQFDCTVLLHVLTHISGIQKNSDISAHFLAVNVAGFDARGALVEVQPEAEQIKLREYNKNNDSCANLLTTL